MRTSIVASSLLLALLEGTWGLTLGPAVEKPHEDKGEAVRRARAEREERKKQQREEKRQEEERKLAEHQAFVERQKERAHKKLQEKKDKEMAPIIAEQKKEEDHKAFVERQKERAHKRLAEKKAAEEAVKAEERAKIEEEEKQRIAAEEEAEKQRIAAEKKAEKERIQAEKAAMEQKAREEREAKEREEARILAEQKYKEEQAKMKVQWEAQHKKDQEMIEQRKKLEQEEAEALEKTLAASRAVCEKIAYIRPQRTAGATLAEAIMPKLTAENNQTQINKYHMEARWAKATAPNCMVASLRDPVERFMSEYSVFKEGSSALAMDEWDIHANDLPSANILKSMKVTEGFQTYLQSTDRNPTFNRQARYLLGFERVACSERCCGICSNGNPGYPAQEYDFNARHDELVAKAKEALASLRGFTIAECFPESLRALAKSVGWHPDEAEDLARQFHLGAQTNATVLSDMRTGFGSIAPPADYKSWSAILPDAMIDIIRHKNLVDAELLIYAKQLLYERHGIKCGGN